MVMEPQREKVPRILKAKFVVYVNVWAQYDDGTVTLLFQFEEVSLTQHVKNNQADHNNIGQCLTTLAHTALRDQLKWTQSQYSGGQAKCIQNKINSNIVYK